MSVEIKEPDLAEEWQEYRTSDLIAQGALAIGDGYRAKNSELASAGIPFARVGNINGGFDFNDTDLFPEADLAKAGEKVSRPGDVVFTSKGTVGRFAFVRQETPRFVYSPQLCYWRSLNPEVIDPKFLLYWMQSSEFWLQAEGVKGQTDMADYVSLGDQRRMFLTLPPIDEQRAIARILGALDDKIDLNRRMNRNLEAMAQAIFRSWFVDFEPVSAKREGRRPVGMDDATAAMFPEHFQETEMGPIPAGWRIEKVEECIVRHGVAKKYEQKTVFSTGKVPVLDQGRSGIIGYHNDVPGVEASIERPVIVFANHTCYMRLITFSFSAIQNVLPFTGKNLDTIWTFFATAGLQEFLEYKGHWPDFVINKIVVPTEELTKAFGDTVRGHIKRIRQNEIQNETLRNIRDTLLPQLLAGELRVRQAEKMIGEA